MFGAILGIYLLLLGYKDASIVLVIAGMVSKAYNDAAERVKKVPK